MRNSSFATRHAAAFMAKRLKDCIKTGSTDRLLQRLSKRNFRGTTAAVPLALRPTCSVKSNLRTEIQENQVQRVKLTLCKLATGRFFISERPEILRTREVGKPERTEVTGGKNRNRAGGEGGGDYTFSAFASQIVSWGPLALRHDMSCRCFFPGDEGSDQVQIT